MSYRNPKQFLDSTANPFAEGLDKGFDNMKAEIEEDRIEQEKIQKREDEMVIALGNNIGKLPGSTNPALKSSFAEMMRTESEELRSLTKALPTLSGAERDINLLRQEEIKGNVDKYGKNMVTVEFLSKKLKDSMSKNPGEAGYISKSTGAPLQNLIRAYNNGDPKLRISKEVNSTFLSLEGSDYKLDLNNATATIDSGEELLKTIEPITDFQETASKTILDPNTAVWKESVRTKIPLKDGSSRVIDEEKINVEKATQELMNNGSFEWVGKRSSYNIANQTWVDRMGQNTIFDNNNPEQVMAVKKWLVEDTIKNVIPQSKLISDAIKEAPTKTKAEKGQVKLNSWWNKNGDDLNKKINKAVGSGKINMQNAEKVFEDYGFTVTPADKEVDGQRFLNSYTITNSKYGKGWKIRIEANDSPSQVMAKIAGQFTGDMQQVAPKQPLPKYKN